MFWLNGWKRQVLEAMEAAVSAAVAKELKVVDEVGKKRARIEELEKSIASLEINQAKKQEEWDRREREVEHKVGLERKRQEFEIAQAKRETTTAVREENLAADRERFKGEMEFQRKHLEGEIGSLRDLVKEMLVRLPSAEVYMEVKRGGSAEQ